MDFNLEKFKQIKEEAEKFYKTIGEVFCPFFQEKVAFNRRGLNHIKFKNWNRTRTLADQYMRWRLLHLAPQILKLSRTLQGVSKTKNFERIDSNSIWSKVLKEVSYYEFIAVVVDVRIRIVVKQIEGGKKFFWSIVPFWKTDKASGRRVLSDGDPETD